MKKEVFDYYYLGEHIFAKDFFWKHTACRRNIHINIGICESEITRNNRWGEEKVFCVVFNSQDHLKIWAKKVSPKGVAIKHWSKEEFNRTEFAGIPNNFYHKPGLYPSNHDSFYDFFIIRICNIAGIDFDTGFILEAIQFGACFHLYNKGWRNDGPFIYLIPQLLDEAAAHDKNKVPRITLNPYIQMSNAGKPVIRE